MIIVCHHCSARLQIDEAKFSTRHFTVRCPKCTSEVHSNGGTATPNDQSAVNAGGATAAGSRFSHPKPAPLFELDQPAPEREGGSVSTDKLLEMLSTLVSQQSFRGTHSSSMRPSWNPRRVLVCIADDKREVLARQLAESGYQVFVAEDTRQAVERMRENQLDVVVIDPRFDATEQGFVFVIREVNMLRPTQRRRLFLVLLSPTLRTMDAHAAFINNVNAIVNMSDIGELPDLIEHRLRDFNELYKEFNEALKVPAL